MTMGEVRTREELRAVIFDAVSTQWDHDIREQSERTPRGHQSALTEAIMKAIPTRIFIDG